MQTENDRILLVIGEVSAAQYREANFALVKAGYRPKVRRIKRGQFFMDDETMVLHYGPVEQRGQIGRLREEHTERAMRIIEESIEVAAAEYVANLGAVAVVVMDEPTWEDWSYDTNQDLLRAIDNRFSELTRWVVRPDGSVEYVA